MAKNCALYVAKNCAVLLAEKCALYITTHIKIKRNFTAIIASAKHGLSNARIEATNNKIKLGIRTAFGFRNPNSLIAMVMLSCSAVQPRLPGR